MREIDKVIVHCSASPDAMDVGFKEIDEWHKQRGWHSPSGIHCGYHFIIRRSGLVEMGRPVEEIGAHCEGENSNSLGICLVGTHEFEKNQMNSLRAIYAILHSIYSKATWHEHREFPSAMKQGKTCPNFSVSKELGC